jgi:hypothetical protein
MKYVTKIFSALVLLTAGLSITPQKSDAQVSVSFQVFYDQLSPYGQWIQRPDYGYVWRPRVEQGFSPYETAGHWVFTDVGWTWFSDYQWGWAPFHYGRWYFDPSYGWVWVPDTEWGPAWVAWRRSSGYYGWAPLSPGITITAGFGGSFDIPSERWVFVKEHDIVRPDVYRYYVPRTQNVTIIKNTTVIKNTYVDKSSHVTYVAGPAKEEVQKVTGKPVNPVVIKEVDKPSQQVTNNTLVIYKPRVTKTSSNGPQPAPAKAVTSNEAKTLAAQASKEASSADDNNKSKQQETQAGSQTPAKTQSTTNPSTQSKEKSAPKSQHKNAQNNNNKPVSKPPQKQTGKPQNAEHNDDDHDKPNQQQ